jgi:hypothetical protein
MQGGRSFCFENFGRSGRAECIVTGLWCKKGSPAKVPSPRPDLVGTRGTGIPSIPSRPIGSYYSHWSVPTRRRGDRLGMDWCSGGKSWGFCVGSASRDGLPDRKDIWIFAPF